MLSGRRRGGAFQDANHRAKRVTRNARDPSRKSMHRVSPRRGAAFLARADPRVSFSRSTAFPSDRDVDDELEKKRARGEKRGGKAGESNGETTRRGSERTTKDEPMDERADHRTRRNQEEPSAGGKKQPCPITNRQACPPISNRKSIYADHRLVDNARAADSDGNLVSNTGSAFSRTSSPRLRSVLGVRSRRNHRFVRTRGAERRETRREAIKTKPGERRRVERSRGCFAFFEPVESSARGCRARTL